jgi:uncharacterized membrane protein YgcG
MAALLVLAAAIIRDKVKEKKDMKRRKAYDDERSHRQLMAEANRKEKNIAVHRHYDSEDEKEGEALPRYEDIVDDGEGSSGSSGSNGSSGSSGSSGSGSFSGTRSHGDAPPEYAGRSSGSRRGLGV